MSELCSSTNNQASTYTRSHSQMCSSPVEKQKSYWYTSSIGPRALSEDNPRHEVALSSLTGWRALLNNEGIALVVQKRVRRQDKFHLLSASKRTVFDVHRTILRKYTNRQAKSRFLIFCFDPLLLPSSPSPPFCLLLARRQTRHDGGCASEPHKRRKSAGGRWMIRGCASAEVSTRLTLRATPSRFSAEPHCFIGKLVGSTRTRHR